MKIIFMGTPEFAVPSLVSLNKAEDIKIEAVVTQPDRKSGRGQKVHFSDIKKKALELDLEVLQSKNVNQDQFRAKLKALKADFIVVVAFGQKLSPELLEMPEYASLNLHASLLPEYRGSSPIHKAIIDGKKISGNTTMYMAEGLDTGDIIYQQQVEIKKDETVGDLHDKLAEKGAKLLLKTLRDIKAGKAPRIPQTETEASFATKIDKKLGLINWKEDAEKIYNLIRGVNPWPGAYTFLDTERVKIWESELPAEAEQKYGVEDAEPGEIIRADSKEGILVQTGSGILAVKKLQLPGTKRMTALDFLNGHQLSRGNSFNSKKS